MNTALWWLVQNTVTVALAIPFVALACRVFHRRPAVQHALWLILLVKLMTPPLALWPWSLDEVRELLNPTTADDAQILAESPSHKMMSLNSNLSFLVADAEPAKIALPVALAPFETDAPTTTSFDVLPVLLYLWLAGAAFCAARQARRIARHTAIIRTAAVADASFMADVAEVATKVGVRPPRTLLAANIIAPFVWFFGRLKLLWPQSMQGRSRARGVIAHELAHIRRRDHWVAWLELLAGIIWWWNPLFWLVRRRLREAAEMACDALALVVCNGDRREYAELLLELSSGPQVLAPVLGVGAGSASSFERRLTMILSERVSGKVSVWGIVTAIVLVAVALPGWSLGQQYSGDNLPERRVKTTTAAGQIASDDKQAIEAEAKLKELQAEINRLNARLKELNSARGKPESHQQLVPPPPPRSGPEFGVSLGDTTYMLFIDNEGARLEAVTPDGKKIWSSRLPGRPARGLGDRFDISKGANDNRLTLTWGNKGEIRHYHFDAKTGEHKTDDRVIVRPSEEIDAAKFQDSYRRAVAAEYERATAAAEAARRQYERLKLSTNKVTKDELDAAKEYWFAKEKDKQVGAGQLKDRLNAAEAALTAAQRDFERMEILAKEGGASGAEREAALARFRAAQVERSRLEQWLTEKARPNDRAKNHERALDQAQQAQRAAAEALDKVYPGSPNRISGVRVGQTSGIVPTSALDIAERYLKAVADLKLARSRLARLPRAEGAASRQEIEEAEIELERAQKQEQLIAAFLADTVRSTQAEREAARNEFQRTEQLVKKGMAEGAILDAARARLAAAEAHVRILESAQRIIQNAPNAPADKGPARR